MSVLKVRNGASWESIPAGGVGVPSGGSAGDALFKSSSSDYSTQWKLPLTMELLWTNGTPSNAFAAQTVAFSYSGFDLLLVRYNITNTWSDPAIAIQSAENGKSVTVWSYLGGNLRKRTAQIVATGIQFNAGVQTSENNNVLIPVAIYGIKGVISS